jgi:hypothetical protein
MISVEQLIRQSAVLPPRPSAKGWYILKCRVCNDHKKRGGFKFESGTVGYNCFNCKHTANYDESTCMLSDKMVTVLKAYGVPDIEIKRLFLESIKAKKEREAGTATTAPQKPKIVYPEVISLPDHFYKIDENSDETWQVIAVDHLKSRGIDPASYPFYLSTGGSKPETKDWKGRLIIPFFRNGQMIFYQGRDLLDKKPNKYKSSNVTSDAVMYGYDQITQRTDEPLFIVEGFFDAFSLNGVAILGNKFTQTQIDILRTTSRPKIYIPDRFGDGFVAAEQAIDAGWSVSFFDSKYCKDVDDAVKKYGKLFVTKSLIENVKSGAVAKAYVRTLCSKSKSSTAKKTTK